MRRTLLIGVGLALVVLWVIPASNPHPSRALAETPKVVGQPRPLAGSGPRDLSRLERRMEQLAQEQEALSGDVETLYQELDEAGAPVDAPDDAEVLARAQAHQRRLGQRLLYSPPDPQAEHALRDHMTLAAGEEGPAELLSVQCSAELCRVDVAMSDPDPLGLLMSCPVLGGELMSAPNEQDSSVMTFYVAREGALPG